MELTVLDSNFQRSKMIEGHSSLIWTERFGAAGDFSRESYDVGGTMMALPVEDPVTGSRTIVAIRGSSVPMIVEDHIIEKSLTAGTKITTTGRSLETALDRRTTIKTPLGSGAPVIPWISSQKTAVDAAYDVMNQVVTLGSASLADQIPEFDIKVPVRPDGYVAPESNVDHQVDPGELYAWVLQQIATENYGIRAVLPAAGTTKISIELYTGVDKTLSVIFDARFDQFDNSKYLLSTKGWKNVDQVNAASDSLEVIPATTPPTGLDRRTVYQDASTTVVGSPSPTLTNLMKNVGTVDLAKQLQTALFSGQVSRQMGSMYAPGPTNYGLGDIVKLTGDYGLSQLVRIAEFIRSDDSTGEKAYPTFASL